MLIAVKAIAVIMILAGIIYLVRPQITKQLIKFFAKEKRIYFGGIINILIGILLLLAAPQCRISAVAIVLGILSLVKGILVFILGFDKVKSMMEWWGSRPLSFIRLMGLIPLAMGILLILSV